MTDNVVLLKKPDPLIWICKCGCATFKLYSDDTMECAQCGVMSAAECEWVKEPVPLAPRAPAEVEKVATNFQKTSAMVLREAMNKVGDPIAIILIIRDSGEQTAWGNDCVGEARIAWLDRQFAKARKIIVKEV